MAIESASAKETFGAGEDVMGRFATKGLRLLVLVLRVPRVAGFAARAALLAALAVDFEHRRPKVRARGKATLTRLELARAEPSRFLVCPLNHSGTVSLEFSEGMGCAQQP